MLFGHSQDLAAALPFIRAHRPAYWKAIDPDPAAASEVAALGTRLIVRHNIGVPETALSFVQSARRQVWFPFAWALESPNEPFPFFALPPWYPAWEASFVHWCHVYSKVGIVGNMGSHQPLHIVPGATVYGLHAYFGTLGGWPDVAGEWAKIRAVEPGVEFFVTEMGFTDAVNRSVPAGEDYEYGWREHLTAGVYARQLFDFTEKLADLPGFRGAFIFQHGAQPGGVAQRGWSSFEVAGVPEIEAMMSAGEVREGRAMGESMLLGAGMAAKAAALGQDCTGEQLTGEIYLKDGQGRDTYSYALFEKCEIRYYPAAGRTVAVPFL